MAQTQNTEDATLTPHSLCSNVLSQTLEPIAWGRLYSKRMKTKSMGMRFKVINFSPVLEVDLCKESVCVGRDKNSDLRITEEIVLANSLNKISKIHFVLTRELCDISKPVYIMDYSLNGTFVNGELIGQNNKRILQTDDNISMAYPNWKDFGISDSESIPQDILSKYFVSKKLGSGAGGFVRLVYDRHTCVEYAMKQVKKNALTKFTEIRNLNDPARVMNEAKIMGDLMHPCIIKLHDIVDKPDSVFMILEYMKGGDLLTRIIKKKRLSEATSKLFFYQICHAIKYLHDKGITHRDIKPDNVLLETNDEEALIKVSDFGLSKLVSNDSVMKTVCGTPLYVAPEVLMTGGRGTYTEKVDIWSLGVVLFTCLSGTLPFSDEYGSPASDQIKEGRYNFSHSSWKSVSLTAKSLIVNLLTVDCNKRPSIDYVLGHKWLLDTEIVEKANALMNLPSCYSKNRFFLEPPKKRLKR